MAQSTPKKKLNLKQKEFILDFCETNRNALFGKFMSDHGKKTKDDCWTNLTVELNKMGVQKSVDAWKMVNQKTNWLFQLNKLMNNFLDLE